MLIIYCILTFVPVLTSFQLFFSFRETKETRQKLALIFSSLVTLFMIACAVVNSEYIVKNNGNFRIPALVLNALMIGIALFCTIIASKNNYNSLMVFRKIKKYIGQQLQEVAFEKE